MKIKFRKNFLLIFVCSVIVLTLTACTSNQSNNSSISYTDSFGYTSTISAVPNTIISLSPNTTEILCYLGLENKIIGRTDYCDYPSTISNIPSIGTITEPNIEKIAELNPDIIITDGMQSEETIKKLRDLGFTVIITRANETIDGTYEIISDIGKVTGTSNKSTEIINNMKDELAKIEAKVNSISDKKTVYYSIMLGDEGLYTAGANTYINEVLEKAGLINIATDMDGWTYNIENLIQHNPDYIICSELYDAKSTILNYQPIKSLNAVKNLSIIEIDENILSRQGPRNIDAIKELIKQIYNIEI